MEENTSTGDCDTVKRMTLNDKVKVKVRSHPT